MAVAAMSRAVSQVSGVFSAAGPWGLAEVSGELDVATAPALLDQVGRVCAVRGSGRNGEQLYQRADSDGQIVERLV
ncbi:hypothetical protein [Actinomadura miaoliensis]|uniref:Uncharacterized protein n=1 Tax=Actinomadura miaoliensis TaxID=430685 RepID=A0ABP7UV67_9ACTN